MRDRDRQFLAYYEIRRVQHQLAYYRSKTQWHGQRDDRYVLLTGMLMFAASVSSAALMGEWTWFGLRPAWAVAAAIVPALSGAVAATRALYEHERNRERFENTYLDLEYVRATRAPTSDLPDGEFAAKLAEYVGEVEALLSREHRQWVQIMEEAELRKPPEPPSPRREQG